MGMFDTFWDKKKEIQLKNFDCVMRNYSVGDKIPMKEFGYPKTASFYCFAHIKAGFVIVKDNIFIGIKKKPLKNETIFSCGGEEVVVK